MNGLRLFLQELKIEHTLFALPFAYAGALLAARGVPSAHVLVWITLAVLGARTAAMSANRLLDAKIDKKNPRTAGRAVASGKLPASTMIVAIVAGLGLLTLAAYELNPLCLALLPIGAAGVVIYPLVKRWTWAVHFVLGAVDALAPLGAFIGIAGRIDASAVLLFVAVTIWVAGFDIIYALMDLPVDVVQGIRSLPARFGERSGRLLPLALHVSMSVVLAADGIVAQAGWPYFIGVAGALALAAYEAVLFRTSPNFFVLNERIFITNMGFSIFFLATTIAGYLVR